MQGTRSQIEFGLPISRFVAETPILKTGPILDIVFDFNASRPKDARQLRKPLILVVDDQHMIADTTAMVLNQSGFRAQCAYSGQTALQTAIKLKPDYLLTDIVMPGMSGVDLAICVRNQLPATIIVLFSGQAGVTDLIRESKDADMSSTW